MITEILQTMIDDTKAGTENYKAYLLQTHDYGIRVALRLPIRFALFALSSLLAMEYDRFEHEYACWKISRIENIGAYEFIRGKFKNERLKKIPKNELQKYHDRLEKNLTALSQSGWFDFIAASRYLKIVNKENVNNKII